jgi:hypothetical protein
LSRIQRRKSRRGSSQSDASSLSKDYGAGTALPSRAPRLTIVFEAPMSINRFAALLFFTAAGSFAQGLTFGFVGGVPLTVLLRNDNPQPFGQSSQLFSDITDRSVLGASLGWRFRGGFGLEADALHRHLSYRDSLFELPTVYETEEETVSAGDWEFPLLVKYRLPGEAVRPYFSAGAALDVLTASSKFSICCTPIYDPYTLNTSEVGTTGTTSSPYGFQHKSVVGVAVGLGLDVRWGPIHVLPEIRFTRWTREHLNDIIDNSTQNQVEFLVGISR